MFKTEKSGSNNTTSYSEIWRQVPKKLAKHVLKWYEKEGEEPLFFTASLIEIFDSLNM